MKWYILIVMELLQKNEVLEFCEVKEMPHNLIDIQSSMCNACGWYCLAFLYWINVCPHRTMNLYRDAEHFTSLFNNLNETNYWKQNEYTLKLFFRSPTSKPHIDIRVKL